MSDVALLHHGLMRLQDTPPRVISSPATQPRRAAVALVVRIVPSPYSRTPFSSSSLQHPTSLSEFFSLDWVNDSGAHAEILFLRRDDRRVLQTRISDAHFAFPGGRMAEGDENALYTAMRQTWEEVGLDLGEKDFMCIGRLDDREITTSLGKRLLMILSPFVFLQLTPFQHAADPPEGTTLHWIPIDSLLASTNTLSRQSCRRWTTVAVDVYTRLAPRSSTLLRLMIRLLVGSMRFNAIVLNTNSTPPHTRPSSTFGPLDEKKFQPEQRIEHPFNAGTNSHDRKRKNDEVKLWGLSLGMTLDFMAYLTPATFMTDYPRDEMTGLGLSITPSMPSVFPVFSYPDVNFWIWVFGKRYRQVLRSWEQGMRAGGANDKRLNWAGSALSSFYAAVRKALIVVIILRAIGVLVVLGTGCWWLFYH